MARLAKIIGGIFLLVVSVLSLCTIRTILLIATRSPMPVPCEINESEGYLHVDERLPRLKKALQFKTVSIQPHQYDRQELRNMVQFISESYPHLFRSPYVRKDIINDYSLLISVKGSDSSLLPYMLTGHIDVVPVVQQEWKWSGFAAEEDEDGFIYARGAIDNKGCVMAQLEALDFLLKRGIQPRRSFFLGFGHDEEVMGFDGASKIAKELHRRGVHKLEFLFDEGLPGLKNLISGFEGNIFPIGVTEKGRANLNFSVHVEGGHSSAPPKQTSIGILSAAMAKLEANQLDIIFDDLTQAFIESIALDLTFPLNVICSNLWLFKPLVGHAMANGMTQGLVRTTTAITIIKGGLKSNVIPPTASSLVNFRIHPSQSVQKVIDHARRVINDDRVNIYAESVMEPHPISPYDATKDRPYSVIEKSLRQIFPEAIPVPATMTANSDTIHYLNFTKSIYRLTPIIIEKSDVTRIHGRDERISRKSYEKLLNFYYHVMLNADNDVIDISKSHDGQEL